VNRKPVEKSRSIIINLNLKIMKKFRVILASSALLLAFGAAFASDLAFTYYQWRPASGSIPAACVPQSPPFECIVTPNANPCSVLIGGDLIQLRETAVVENQCGAQLFKKPL
jgi:hypothetical protein